MGWSMKSSLVNDIDKVFRACLRPFIAAWNLIASHWELVYQQLKNGWTYKKIPHTVLWEEKNSHFDLRRAHSTGYDLLMDSLLIKTLFKAKIPYTHQQFPLYHQILAKIDFQFFSNISMKSLKIWDDALFFCYDVIILTFGGLSFQLTSFEDLKMISKIFLFLVIWEETARKKSSFFCHHHLSSVFGFCCVWPKLWRNNANTPRGPQETGESLRRWSHIVVFGLLADDMLH